MGFPAGPRASEGSPPSLSLGFGSLVWGRKSMESEHGMDTPPLIVADHLISTRALGHNGNGSHVTPVAPPRRSRAARPPDPEKLRHWAWTIGEQKPTETYIPSANHVGLGMVNSCQGLAHWRILPDWVEQTSRRKGEAWRDCRLILRLYDVSFIEFNGFNAHEMRDFTLPGLCGQQFFQLPRPGTWQLGEVGFLLRNGEFLPAARSFPLPFPRTHAAPQSSNAALLVEPNGYQQEVPNVWEQDAVLHERRKPRLRNPLRIAAFAFESQVTGHAGQVAQFVSELAAGQTAHGHEVHVFLPATGDFAQDRQVGNVHYHPLAVRAAGSALEQAKAFARAAERRLRELPRFDLFHVHEWMAGLGGWVDQRPTVFSLTSIEATRTEYGGSPCLEIEQAERTVAQGAGCVLMPHALRERALPILKIDAARVHASPMGAKLPNEWEAPLDYGQVKREIGLGPLDRMMLFVGPLEHASGVDLLIEALPHLLSRCNSLRLAYAGNGGMAGHLQHRANQLGVGHAVRLLGHVERPTITRLMRSAEALVLPSRYRVPWDDAVVDLARLAARPVVTTHSGPSHLVRHEENGILTYDNPGSMVWALDRVLHDPVHAQRMGHNGRRVEGGIAISWNEVVAQYLDVCAVCFPELRAR